MTVNTKGVVLTPVKSFFPVVHSVARALDRVQALHAKAMAPELRRYHPDIAAMFGPVDIRVSAHADMAQFCFVFMGEHRMLTLHFDCDCDNRDLAPASLSMSMGAHGHSELHIKTALLALSYLGPTFYQASDTTEEWVALPAPLKSVAQAAALGFVGPMTLRDWGHTLNWTPHTAPEWEAMMGVTYERFQTADSFEDWNAIVGSVPAPEVAFLAESLQAVTPRTDLVS